MRWKGRSLFFVKRESQKHALWSSLVLGIWVLVLTLFRARKYVLYSQDLHSLWHIEDAQLRSFERISNKAELTGSCQSPAFPEAPAGPGQQRVTREPGREALLGKQKPVKMELSAEAGEWHWDLAELRHWFPQKYLPSTGGRWRWGLWAETAKLEGEICTPIIVLRNLEPFT